jgi:hypothetical protein
MRRQGRKAVRTLGRAKTATRKLPDICKTPRESQAPPRETARKGLDHTVYGTAKSGKRFGLASRVVAVADIRELGGRNGGEVSRNLRVRGDAAMKSGRVGNADKVLGRGGGADFTGTGLRSEGRQRHSQSGNISDFREVCHILGSFGFRGGQKRQLMQSLYMDVRTLTTEKERTYVNSDMHLLHVF